MKRDARTKRTRTNKTLRALPWVLLLAVGCGSSTDDPLDRTGFDIYTCGEITPGEAVDYLELRVGSFSSSRTGMVCDNALDPATCGDEFGSVLQPADAWAERPSGGAPSPTAFLVFTRADEVGVVGENDIGAFLSPVTSAANAVFLAQVETQGSVGCDTPSLREVAGGFEVIATTTFPCGGAVIETLVFVGEDGATTVLETAEVNRGRNEVCP